MEVTGVEGERPAGVTGGQVTVQLLGGEPRVLTVEPGRDGISTLIAVHAHIVVHRGREVPARRDFRSGRRRWRLTRWTPSRRPRCRAAQGDPASLAVFVRGTQAAVWRFCAHQVDPSAADDLTQETFLRALRALGGFRAESSAQTWLLGVARHVCLDELRRRGRGPALVALDEDDAGPRRAGGASPDPSATVVLDRLVAALPDDRREAFVLTQIVGLTYAETAAICGCEVGTIRSRAARARAALVDALADDIGTGHRQV